MLHEALRCYQESLQLAEELCKEAASWPRGLGYLADQVRRAMASVVLNIAEGNARKSHCERKRFFEVSRASATEVSACVDLMSAFGLVSASRATAFKTSLSNISRMIWGLIRKL